MVDTHARTDEIEPVGSDRATDETLHLLARTTAFTSLQADPEVMAPGEVLCIGGVMLEPESPHAQVGTFGIQCSATGANGSELLCHGGYILPGGKIAVQMLIIQPDEALRFAAITGGTGVYRRVRGEATGATRANGDEDVTFIFAGR